MRARIEEGVVCSPYADCPPLDGTSTYTFLMKRLASHGSKTAAICGDDKLTYSEMWERMQLCAAALRREGIGPGARVYVHVENSIDSFVALCGVPMTGATLVTSDTRLPEDEIFDRVKRSSATHVLTDGKYAGLFTGVKDRFNIKDLLLLGESKLGFKSISPRHAGNQFSLQDLDFASDSCNFVVWTTGSTGVPKCVEIPESHFLRQIVCREANELLTSEDVFLADSNVSYFFMFSMWFMAVCVGSTIVISKKCEAVPRDTFDIIENYKSVAMVSFPPRLRRILTAIETSRNSCTALQKSLRKLLVVGISMPPSFVEVLTRTFQLRELRSGYGMSEVGGFLTVPPSGEISGMNVGFPVSNTKMMVADAISGKVLGPMERGELLFYSPYIGSAYRADLDTREDFEDAQGWFHTGDLGYYDQDGRLFLCGRLKTNFKSMAKTVIPSEIEQCLLEHEAVKEVAVLGVPTPEFDQAPTAVVVSKSGYISDQRLAEDLKSYVAGRMPVYKHLRGGVYFADALPQNSLGKVRIIALKELLGTLRGKDCTQ